MSEKERAIQLIEEISDNKMIFVINLLKSIKGLLVEEVEPDEWDLKMIEESECNNFVIIVSFDELLEKEGLTYADL